MSPTNFSDQVIGSPPVTADLNPCSGELPEADVEIVTSDGLRIPAHRSILASASPVLESIIDRPRKHRSSDRTIPVLGVPCDAVSVFIRFLYAPKCTEEEMGKYGIHLLALSHVFLVPQLKQRSTRAVGERLTIDNVIDVLQLARLCDAPDLHLKCMKLVSTNFKSVKKTEEEEEDEEAQGGTELVSTTKRGDGVFGAHMHRRVHDGGAVRHGALQEQGPLQFKTKAQQEMKKGTEDAIRWKLLVRKVVSAKAISSLSLPKRKREEEARERSDHHGVIRSFRL
ncbi:hypothetical protein RHMOL_Rhmol08G0250700 [Rhododendron molle]|uniref:Uncharacterized protein n=1 Tax=Rhododendron molle TaxID=49168 RepID=A0ACC0MSH1_RHOML|nr:hypothetical protein RHMOL_Rhmol08G0250700 [Rhododendron molle]